METFRATISENGRILIPAAIRNAMSLNAGDEVVLILDDSNLQIKTRRQVMEDVQNFFIKNIPGDISLVDELIKERRADAAKENE